MTHQLTEPLKIGENDVYWFGVARLGDRWLGFAKGQKPAEEGGSGMLFMLPGVADARHEMGCLEKDKAIRMTSAVADALEYGYGGITRWLLADDLRAEPDEFRCPECQEMDCFRDHDVADLDPF